MKKVLAAALALLIAVSAHAQLTSARRGPIAATAIPNKMALMVTAAPNVSLLAGLNNYLNIFGTDAYINSEGPAQYVATEGATFSKLRTNIISGNSGTATFTFRNNSGAGTQTFQITGVNAGEDTTHSDTVTAGNPFAVHYTDNGTDSRIAWMAGNVLFASGTGNFHGSANFAGGAVYDLPSTTMYLGFHGPMIADGQSTEANIQFRNRAYTSLEAVQIRLSATNARTNDTVFTVRVNETNTAMTLTISSGAAAGLYNFTGGPVTLADADRVNISMVTGTGVEDMNIAGVLGTFKSTTGKSEVFNGGGGGVVRAASTTATYYQIGGSVTTAVSSPLTEAQAAIKVGFAATVSNLRCYASTNTYTGTGASEGTIKLYVNGAHATGMTQAITASGGAGWYENTSNTVTIDDDDVLSIEIDEGSSGNFTIRTCGVTFTAL